MIGSGTKIKKSEVKEVKFCDLEKYNGKMIKTQLEYSGFEEYWSAGGFSKCDLNHKVALDFDEYYDSWRWLLIDRKLSKLHNKYYKYKAKMTVIGIFEIDTINGFGHLNLKKARILVKKVKIKLIKKKIQE